MLTLIWDHFSSFSVFFNIKKAYSLSIYMEIENKGSVRALELSTSIFDEMLSREKRESYRLLLASAEDNNSESTINRKMKLELEQSS